jgi:AcrR family transcriptional regulator
VRTPQNRLAVIGDAAIGLIAENGMRGLTHRAVDAAAGLPSGSTSYYASTRAALLELVMARMLELDQADLAGSPPPDDPPAPVRRAGLSRNRHVGPEGVSFRQAEETAAQDALSHDASAQANTTSDGKRDTSAATGTTVPNGDSSAAADMTGGGFNLDEIAGSIAGQLHSIITGGRIRMLARYEFALESTRRPALRSIYDSAGAQLRDPAILLLRASGSPDPERQAHSLVAWCEGMLFDSIAGAGRENPPSQASLHTSLRELLHGMLGR